MRRVFILAFIIFFSSGFSQNTDLDILRSINNGDNSGLDQSMKYTSFSVFPYMGISTAGILLTGYIKKDSVTIRNGYRTAIALCFNVALTEGLKYSFRRKRPYQEYPNDIVARDEADGYSMPSGHTSCAFSTATALTLSTRKWYVGVPAYALAGAIAYSRMRLGVHYPSDVLGGIVTGIGSTLLTWQMDKWLKKKRSRIPVN
jgi:membrane-associated phospholipid phosphatase